MAGFEPTTSRVQAEYSDQTELHPDDVAPLLAEWHLMASQPLYLILEAGEGFKPSMSVLQTDALITWLPRPVVWCRRRESNPRIPD